MEINSLLIFSSIKLAVPPIYEPDISATLFYWSIHPFFNSSQIACQMLQIQNQIRPIRAFKEPSQIHW